MWTLPIPIPSPPSWLLSLRRESPTPGHIFPILLRRAAASISRGSYAMLYLEQSVYNPTTNLLNSPTSWYWNIRIGDKIQLNNTGIWYTIVGPMNIYNPELFVNVGDPGATPPLLRTLNGTNYNPEFLFLVNGVDDNKDGYVDNGWDGVDNDGDGIVDQVTPGINLGGVG